jgi:hypothetical protein
MLFICAEPDLKLSSEDREALPGAVETWATDLADRGIRLMGHVFAPIREAKTVRQRNGDLLVTDGPLAKTREPVAGFNLLECETFEQPLEISSRHPMDEQGSLELRAIATWVATV